MYDMTVLEKGCENLGISLDENQKEQFISPADISVLLVYMEQYGRRREEV